MKTYLFSISMILCTSLQSAESDKETIVKTYDEELSEQRLKAIITGAYTTLKQCLRNPSSSATSDSYTPRYHKLFNSSDLVSLQNTRLHEGDIIYTQPVPGLKNLKSYIHADVSGGTGVEERIQERDHMLYRLCTGTVHAYSFYQAYENNSFTTPIVEFFEYEVNPTLPPKALKE